MKRKRRYKPDGRGHAESPQYPRASARQRDESKINKDVSRNETVGVEEERGKTK